MDKTQLIGFEKPVPAIREHIAAAIMFGKFLVRDDEAAYYEYKGCVYMLPKAAAFAEKEEGE